MVTYTVQIHLMSLMDKSNGYVQWISLMDKFTCCIIGEDLICEIGDLIHFAKISRF